MKFKIPFESWSYEQLKSMKYFLFFIIVADIFGIYWYFGLKKLGIAILLVSMILLGIIFFYETKKAPPEPKQEKRPKDTPKVEYVPTNPKESPMFNITEGLGIDVQNYNKNLEKAMGV